ncbi:hypothetical protein PoB_000488100 [Plakobranchus ocellatus]|uniref:Uncharacterized protein n=1 Tax=Plakobranchus ocellatus TaxID=259542 RepID=A0AAV3Y5A3_9GAST|nr:hypothetical protein PoB_000488100 [Plakobranchus ocellatus]
MRLAGVFGALNPRRYQDAASKQSGNVTQAFSEHLFNLHLGLRDVPKCPLQTESKHHENSSNYLVQWTKKVFFNGRCSPGCMSSKDLGVNIGPIG